MHDLGWATRVGVWTPPKLKLWLAGELRCQGRHTLDASTLSMPPAASPALVVL